MNTRSNQDMLDLFYQTFIVDRRPMCMNGGYCSYKPRHQNQVGCAIGVALSPEDQCRWANELEGKDLFRIFHDHHQDYSKYFDDRQQPFLNSLQDLHDDHLPHGPESDQIKARITDLCNDFNLKDPQK